MSASTIARWNAIPMERPPAEDNRHTLKRTKDDMDQDDDDDDVSLVSRTPSPPPPGDAMDIDKYDEYARGAPREVITVDTKISSSNKGFAMLAKFGWVEGQPLGLSGDGRVDPVPFVLKNDSTGLGKITQDVRMIESTVSSRRELDSERMTRETEEQRKHREAFVAKKVAVQSELSTVLRPFYCELCDKQFQNVAQYDEHTNSYAHHHRARLRDVQSTQRVTFASDPDKRKEKERKREEKELRKIAKAAGIKITKPLTASGVPSADTPTSSTPAPAPAAQPTEQDSKPSLGPKKGGWATVGPSSFAPAQPAATMSASTTYDRAQQPGHAKQGWAAVQERTQHDPPSHSSGPAPAFRTGGWTSLDTGSNVPPVPSAPPPQPTVDAPRPPAPAPARGGWAPAQPSSSFAPAGGWQSAGPAAPPLLPPQSIAASSSTVPSNTPAPVVQTSAMPQSAPAPPKAQRAESARSGWQQFKSGGSRRR